MLRATAAGLALAAVFAAAAPAARIEGPFGTGAAQVWILRPAGVPTRVVVFGHGWKSSPPQGSSWVRQFLPWLVHLADGGAAVIFPRYQLGGGDPQNAERVRAYEQGVSTGYARLGRPHVPLVLAGYSFGASLAFYLAADARRLKLPEPQVVDAVFPAGMIPGATLGTLPRSVQVLIQVGDRDTEAGSGGAHAFWAWLRRHPSNAKRYEVVRSTSSFSATHAAPKGTSADARRAFWTPLDRLIASAT
jgi:dienelactone hydrolase